MGVSGGKEDEVVAMLGEEDGRRNPGGSALKFGGRGGGTLLGGRPRPRPASAEDAEAADVSLGAISSGAAARTLGATSPCNNTVTARSWGACTSCDAAGTSGPCGFKVALPAGGRWQYHDSSSPSHSSGSPSSALSQSTPDDAASLRVPCDAARVVGGGDTSDLDALLETLTESVGAIHALRASSEALRPRSTTTVA